MKSIHDTRLKRIISWLPVIFSILLFNGCIKVGPDYIKPELPLPQEWHNHAADGVNCGSQAPQAQAAWWKTLEDPELSGLMERAVVRNIDIKKATARIREARARRGIATAGFFPTLDTTGVGSRSHASEKLGNGTTTELYTAGFDATWELDIFGGKRRENEAANATLQAVREDQRDVCVSLLAEVALNYLDARSYRDRLAVMTANLKTQDETLQLITWLNQAGLSDELAREQARSNLETTRSQIPPILTGFEAAANRLSVLLGEPPGTLHGEILTCKHMPVTPESIAIGVPADILRQRPDVRKAERYLMAQTAKIGIATAELYPKLTLNGSIGLEALSLGNLFSADSRTNSRAALISWRLFDAGAIRGNIEIQSALKEQYLLDYEATVLSAMEEVENAMKAFSEEQNRKKSLSAATQAARNSSEMAQNNYQAGLSDFNTVLDAERAVLVLQDQLVQSEWAVVMNVVRIYKSLGGGWTAIGP